MAVPKECLGQVLIQNHHVAALHSSSSEPFVQIKTHIFASHQSSLITMNKAELVSKIAGDTGLTKVQSTAALESFMDGVSKALKSGKKITLVGFGTFSVKKRAARKGRNPATGETIRLKAKRVVKFKMGKDLGSML